MPLSNADQTGLTEEENRLAADIDAWLQENNSEDLGLVRERFVHLRSLEAAVFAYPSIRNTQFLKGLMRDEPKLAETVLAFSSSSNLLHTPTKVVAMKSFLVAKFHAFSLLYYLTEERPDFNEAVKTIVFSIVSTLMAEEVYFTCLEDTEFSHQTKASLVDDLIALWDNGTDPRGIRHLSALSSLWIARDAAPPGFGTMDGNTELLRISMELEGDWREFLINESSNEQTRWALEEFLFGLSWEEIQQVRANLARSEINAVGYDEIRSYLASKPSYSTANGKDPKAIYDFFIERRDACKLRKRFSSPGPLHTLEEIYLKYRIVMELHR